MAIAFNCPHCGHAFEVEDSYAGQTGPCAHCKQPMTIPGTLSAFAGSAAYDQPPQKGSSAPWIIAILAGGLVFAVMCGGVLLALLLPAVQAAREAARRNQCINNQKNIGLAFHNHHDVHRSLPLASTEPVSGIPGNGTSPNAAGYGWTVGILPYLEEMALFDQIANQSQRMQVPPFDNLMTQNDFAGCVELIILRCPSSSAPNHVDAFESDYEEYPYAGTSQSPAISSYLSLPSSHLVNPSGPAELFDPTTDDRFNGNGMLPFPFDPSQNISRGLGFNSCTDGMSQTVLVCETKEPAYAAWIDGQATWGVGAWPENVEIPTESGPSDQMLGWPESDFSSMTSLAAAQAARYDPSIIYMESSRFGGSFNRKFGPSSDHAGGAVNHVFVDGHVQSIMSDIDRNAYLRMISRNGAETINMDSSW